MFLRVIKLQLSVYTDMIFVKCTHVCVTQQLIKTLYQLWIYIPYWADEIAETRQDMNTRGSAFTVTQKLYIIKLTNCDETQTRALNIQNRCQW